MASYLFPGQSYVVGAFSMDLLLSYIIRPQLSKNGLSDHMFSIFFIYTVSFSSLPYFFTERIKEKYSFRDSLLSDRTDTFYVVAVSLSEFLNSPKTFIKIIFETMNRLFKLLQKQLCYFMFMLFTIYCFGFLSRFGKHLGKNLFFYVNYV